MPSDGTRQAVRARRHPPRAGADLAARRRAQLPEDQRLPAVHRVRELPPRGAVAHAHLDALLPPGDGATARWRRRPSARSRRSGCRTARGIPVAALSHGEQRQLEIAMTLATRPKVLLLDEPLAGMGAEESARMVELLQKLARDARDPAGRARHGRRVRGGRHAHGDGQRHGARLGHAGGDPRRTRRCRRPTWARRRRSNERVRSSRRRGLHTYYGVEPHPARRGLRGAGRGETVGPHGPQRHGQDDAPARACSGWCKPRDGAVRVKGREMTRAAPHSDRAAGASPTCPRGAASSRTCRCARTW